MNREQTLAILYEMALMMSGETHAAQLTQKMLQKLLYHTSFSCGFFITCGTSQVDDACMVDAWITDVICGRKGKEYCKRKVAIPYYHFNTAGMNVTAKLEASFPGMDKYKYFLSLPVSEKECFVLFANSLPEDRLPVTTIFEPVLKNFSKALSLCRENENHTRMLEENEKRLRMARNDAVSASRAKSEFLSNMSHELRTPLNAILGFAQLLEIMETPPLAFEQKDCVDEIIRAGQHLLLLINDVLDMSRIESGNIELFLDRVSPQSVIAECEKLVSNIARDKQVRIVVEPLDDCDVYSDRVRTRQVLLNLLSNGVKYNRQNGKVTIRTQLINKHTVRIMVSDTGSGIPEEKHTKLFQAFERLGQEAGVVEGTGIGLVISRKLATMMGGEIGFKSRFGEGSQFWIDLPRYQEKHESIEQS